MRQLNMDKLSKEVMDTCSWQNTQHHYVAIISILVFDLKGWPGRSNFSLYQFPSKFSLSSFLSCIRMTFQIEVFCMNFRSNLCQWEGRHTASEWTRRSWIKIAASCFLLNAYCSPFRSGKLQIDISLDFLCCDFCLLGSMPYWFWESCDLCIFN